MLYVTLKEFPQVIPKAGRGLNAKGATYAVETIAYLRNILWKLHPCAIMDQTPLRFLKNRLFFGTVINAAVGYAIHIFRIFDIWPDDRQTG